MLKSYKIAWLQSSTQSKTEWTVLLLIAQLAIYNNILYNRLHETCEAAGVLYKTYWWKLQWNTSPVGVLTSTFSSVLQPAWQFSSEFPLV